jgi:hypothetical protein
VLCGRAAGYAQAQASHQRLRQLRPAMHGSQLLGWRLHPPSQDAPAARRAPSARSAAAWSRPRPATARAPGARKGLGCEGFQWGREGKAGGRAGQAGVRVGQAGAGVGQGPRDQRPNPNCGVCQARPGAETSRVPRRRGRSRVLSARLGRGRSPATWSTSALNAASCWRSAKSSSLTKRTQRTRGAAWQGARARGARQVCGRRRGEAAASSGQVHEGGLEHGELSRRRGGHPGASVPRGPRSLTGCAPPRALTRSCRAAAAARP